MLLQNLFYFKTVEIYYAFLSYWIEIKYIFFNLAELPGAYRFRICSRSASEIIMYVHDYLSLRQEININSFFNRYLYFMARSSKDKNLEKFQ